MISTIHPRERTSIMHVVDSLSLGGTERVAMNLANMMPRDQYQTHLCTTRAEGPLADVVSADVGRLSLNRRGKIDVRAVKRLTAYIRENNIALLHAHGTSVFAANLALLLSPQTRLVWHDHYGRNVQRERPVWLYRLLTKRVSGIFAVSDALVKWSRERLKFPSDRVKYLPNFVEPWKRTDSVELPGTKGKRIVSVANFRPVKDHPNLITAMADVVRTVPDAHLILVGAEDNQEYLQGIRRLIAEHSLTRNVTILGKRSDVPNILRQCDIGVISSTFEGLPISLLEYGTAGLPAVVTDVGQCAEVINGDECGITVQSSDPKALGSALAALLSKQELHTQRGQAFKNRIKRLYSPEASISEVDEMYTRILCA